MQMLIHITSHADTINPILNKMAEAGIHGASVIDCEGMLKSLNEDSVDAPAIFGSLRHFVNPGHQQNKLLLAVIRDEDITPVVDIIHSVAGDLKKPNTGIVFTLPVTRYEGVPTK